MRSACGKKRWCRNFATAILIDLAHADRLAEHRKPRRSPEGFGSMESGKIVIKEDIPASLDAFGADFTKGSFLPDASVKALRYIQTSGAYQHHPRTLERDSCWLSVVYGFGNSSLSLSNILQARAEGRRYIEIQDGWMDAQSPEFEEWMSCLNQGRRRP